MANVFIEACGAVLVVGGCVCLAVAAGSVAWPLAVLVAGVEAVVVGVLLIALAAARSRATPSRTSP